MGLGIRKTRTASEIAEICGAVLEGDGSVELVGPSTLRDARGDQVSFLGNDLYSGELESTQAGAVVLAHGVKVARDDLALLRCDDPNSAFTRVIGEFQQERELPVAGIHPTAWVDPTASVGLDASVGPNASIGAGAVIGAGAALHANVVVGAGSVVGDACALYPGVVLYPGVTLGERVIVHGGSVIGSDGFGFDPEADGWVKVPQCGTVEIGDDVEIGANCAIDRGRFGPTSIGVGVKIDNLVHIAHNVDVGAGSLLVAQVGISGSARLGRGVILAGKAGVSGHIEVGDGARVGAKSGVTKSIGGDGDYLGMPARPMSQELRVRVAQRRLPELIKTVRALEKRVRELEENQR